VGATALLGVMVRKIALKLRQKPDAAVRLLHACEQTAKELDVVLQNKALADKVLAEGLRSRKVIVAGPGVDSITPELLGVCPTLRLICAAAANGRRIMRLPSSTFTRQAMSATCRIVMGFWTTTRRF